MTNDLRFFIDHGMIHDRKTGKHVTTDEDSVFCDGAVACCALLNELSRDWQSMTNAPKSLVISGTVRGHYLELYCPDMVGPTSDPKTGICIGWWEPLMKPPQWYGEASFQLHPTHWRELRPAPADAERKGRQ